MSPIAPSNWASITGKSTSTVTIMGATFGVVHTSKIRITARVGRVRRSTTKGFIIALNTLLRVERLATSSERTKEIKKAIIVLINVFQRASQKEALLKHSPRAFIVFQTDGTM
jgi:hypothetical protein